MEASLTKGNECHIIFQKVQLQDEKTPLVSDQIDLQSKANIPQTRFELKSFNFSGLSPNPIVPMQEVNCLKKFGKPSAGTIILYFCVICTRIDMKDAKSAKNRSNPKEEQYTRSQTTSYNTNLDRNKFNFQGKLHSKSG